MTRRGIIFSVLVVATAFPLGAQTLTMFPYPQSRTTIDLRFLHLLPNKGNSPLSDGTLDLTVNVPVGSRINAVGSIPLTIDSRADGGAATVPGNVFCGIQIAADSARQTVATLGIYFPSSSAIASPIPLYVNRYEVQRYLHNYLAAYLNVGGRLAGGRDYTLHGEAGTTYFAASERSDTSTIIVHYGLGATVGSSDVTFTFEYTGLINFADSFLGLTNKLLHFIGIGATFIGGRIQPGIQIQLPMNQSLRNVIDGAVGVRVSAQL